MAQDFESVATQPESQRRRSQTEVTAFAHRMRVPGIRARSPWQLLLIAQMGGSFLVSPSLLENFAIGQLPRPLHSIYPPHSSLRSNHPSRA